MLEELQKERVGDSLWVDSLSYCQANVLRNETVPWDNPAKIADFFGKMDAIFASDAVLFDVGRAYTDMAASLPAVRQAMGARDRPGYPLKVLLGESSLRTRVVDALIAVAAMAVARGREVVICVPSPPRWLREARMLTSGSSPWDSPLSTAELEAAAIYVADGLRAFAGLRIDTVVVDEGGRTGEMIGSLEAYRAIFNLAEHYGWSVLHRADLDACWHLDPVDGVAASLGRCAPSTQLTRPWGVVTALSASATLLSSGGAPAVTVVPDDADPVDVTRWMSALRSIR
ncbi:MAG: hypothetical protein M0Z34_07125 [Nitrospiraceae bacterium]|nr:hypothetical protein [Nitrospiraceae bacterium]